MLAPGRTSTKVAVAQLAHGHLFDCAVGADAIGCVRHQLGQFVERARRLAHTAHLQPVAEQHHVNQERHLPKEAAVRVDKDHGQAVDKGHGNRQRDQQHHARLAADDLRHGHLQKGNAAIEKDNNGKQRRDPLAARELGHLKTKPVLDHGAVEQNRNRQRQADPEALAEHLLVTAVIHVRAVPIVFTVSAVFTLSGGRYMPTVAVHGDRLNQVRAARMVIVYDICAGARMIGRLRVLNCLSVFSVSHVVGACRGLGGSRWDVRFVMAMGMVCVHSSSQECSTSGVAPGGCANLVLHTIVKWL